MEVDLFRNFLQFKFSALRYDIKWLWLQKSVARATSIIVFDLYMIVQ